MEFWRKPSYSTWGGWGKALGKTLIPGYGGYYLGGALKNIGRRAWQTRQLGGAGSPWSKFKYAVTPQTAWAQAPTPEVAEETTSGGASAPPPSYDTSGGYSSYGSSGTSTSWPVWFLGEPYYDYPSLNAAQQSYVDTLYGREYGGAERNYLANVGELGRSRTELLEEMPKEEERLLTQTGRYYGAIAPDVYQSSEGVTREAIKEKVAEETEKGTSALDRALSSAAADWSDIQAGLQDWKAQMYDQIMNATYEGGETIDTPMTPGYQYRAPTVNWNLAEAMGRTGQLGKTAPKVTAGGSPVVKGRLFAGATQSTKEPKDKTSKLAKYLYAMA